MALFFIVATLFLAPPALHAQECGLTPLPAKPVDATVTTTFLASGGTGEVLVRWRDPATVSIFEVDVPDPSKWKQLSTPAVTSVKPIADETYKRDGFVADSSVIRFVVPEQPVGLWPTRTFVVRVCGGAKNAEG